MWLEWAVGGSVPPKDSAPGLLGVVLGSGYHAGAGACSADGAGTWSCCYRKRNDLFFLVFDLSPPSVRP